MRSSAEVRGIVDLEKMSASCTKRCSVYPNAPVHQVAAANVLANGCVRGVTEDAGYEIAAARVLEINLPENETGIKKH